MKATVKTSDSFQQVLQLLKKLSDKELLELRRHVEAERKERFKIFQQEMANQIKAKKKSLGMENQASITIANPKPQKKKNTGHHPGRFNKWLKVVKEMYPGGLHDPAHPGEVFIKVERRYKIPKWLKESIGHILDEKGNAVQREDFKILEKKYMVLESNSASEKID